MKLVWQRQARAELREAIQYYLDHASINIATEFSGAIEKTATQLLHFPKMGMCIEHHARRLPLHGFPYSLIYRIEARAIIIVAVANQARRPGYWAGRC